MINISTDLGSIYSSLNLRLDRFDTTINTAVQGFYRLQLGTERASNIMDRSVNTAVSNIARSYELWERANERTGRNIFDNSRKIESLREQIRVLDTEIQRSDEILADIERQFGENSEEAETYRARVLDLRSSQADLTEEMRRAERQTGTFAGRLQLLEGEFRRIDERYQAFDKIGDKFQAVGNKLTTHVTLPIIATGTAATKFAFDFEKGAAKVSTIADTTKVSMAELKKGVVDLSNDTGMNTKELNEALYETLSAGVDTAKSVEFLDVAVKAAKGGFTETAVAVDGLTTVLNSYGFEADKANDIANQMLITQNLGKTTFGELAGAVGKVTPIAASLGITTNELFSSLASTTSQGLATAESITALKAAMSNIIKPSKEASEAAEMLGINFNVSAVKSKGWIGFLKEVKEKLTQASPEFAKLSKEFEVNVTKLGALEKAGKKGTDEYKNLSKANKQLTKDLEMMAKMSDSPISAFAQMFGSVEGLNSILMLTSESGISLYNKSMEEMKNNTTALDDAYNKMAETAESKFNKAINKAKNSLMELGIKALPVVEKGINLISNLTDKFSKLSPSTQEWIIKIGLASAALGPFMNLTGGVIKGIGGLLKLGPKISALFGAAGGAGAASGGILELAASFGTAALAAAPWIAAAGAVAYGGYKIYKSMKQEAIPAVDLFANGVEKTSSTIKSANGQIIQSYEETTIKISEETKKAVGAYMELDKGATASLTKLYANRTVLTKQNSQELQNTYNQMNSQIKQGINKQHQDRINSLQKFFTTSKTMSAAEKTEIIQKEQQHNVNMQASQQEFTDKINEIIKRASNEKRQLRADEVKEINMYQEQMRNNAVESLSKEEIESKVILERLKSYSGRITAEQASEVIKNAEKQRVDSVDRANRQFLETKAKIEYMRDVTGSITKEQADRMIKEAERQKVQSIDKANMLKEGVVKRMQEMNADIIKDIDISDGHIMSRWEKLGKFFAEHPIKRWITTKVEQINDVFKNQNNSGLGTYSGLPSVGKAYAVGTNSATPGLHEVAEDGFEIVTNKQYRWFNGGEKVFNHSDSKKLLSALFENKDKPESIAKEAIAQVKESISVTPRIDISESSIETNTGNMLNWGANNQKAYQEFLDFRDKLNKEEVEKSKEYLKEDYENRVKILDDRLRVLKNGNSIELSTEKARIDAQIAHYQKLQKNTKNKEEKSSYADRIASLRQYQKDVLNATKSNQKAQIDSLERSKDALKEYYDDGLKLLNKRGEEVKKSLKIDENLFKNRINEYNEAIKRLSIYTKDLNENLLNNKAIVILQEEKIQELKNRYEELASVFGYTADETINAKKAFGDAKTELISMGNAVDDAKQKIIDAQKEADKKIADSINNLVDRVKNALKQRYDDELKAQEDYINNELKNLDRWKYESIERINDVYDAKIKAIDDQLKAEDKAEKDAEELKKINQLQASLEYEHNEFNKSEIQKELNNLIKEREKRLHKEQLEEQKDKLHKEKEGELKSINAIYESQKDSLEKQLEKHRETHEKMTVNVALQAEAEKMIMDNNQKDIIDLLHSYEGAYQQAGQLLGERLVTGFKPKIEELKSMLASVQASFEEARSSALNTIAAQNAMTSSISSNNANNLTTNSNKTIINNNIAYNSPTALKPSEMLRKTETVLRTLAFSLGR